MSNCTGPNCTHPSHKMVKATEQIAKETGIKSPNFAQMTKNQMKAWRRKQRGK